MTMTPDVSLLVPIHNEEKYVERCLSSIAKQDYPLEKMEILIIDGMSTDGTRAVVQTFIQQHPDLSIKLLDNPQRIVPTGLNIGLRHSKGGVIIRVDGHCVIAKDYVRKCLDHLSSIDGISGVGGPMASLGETWLARAIAIGMSSRFGVGNSTFRTEAGKSRLVDTVPFPAYSWTTVLRVGAYDEELVRNQDDEYNYRLRGLGGKILLADDVRSQYFSRSSLPGIWRQFFQYGMWKVRVLQKHPYQMSLRQFVPPIFVLMLLVAVLLTFVPKFQPLFLIFPGLYLAGNLTASVWSAVNRGLSYLVVLPVIYAAMHIGYGLGFWVGLVRFIRRWNDKAGKIPPIGQRNA